MATPAIIAVTPGIGINLDAISLTVGLNTVVRETMVIADPNVAGNLVAVTSGGALTVTDPILDPCITANVLAVFLPTATVITLTPPSAAAIAAAIVANPPAVTFTGGTITAVTSITNPVTVQQATAANLKATVSGTGVFVVQDSVLDACVTANIVAVSLPAATVITLTPPTAAAIAAAIVANPPAVTVTGSVGVTQSTTPWIVAGGGTAGSPGTAVLTVQGVGGGTTIPVTATIAAAQTIAVTNAGTFAVQATLSAETTKVIGTVNQGTSPWVISGAVTVASTTITGNVAITAASGAFAAGSIASGAIAAGAAAAGAFADGSVYVRSNAAATFPVTATIAAAQTIAVTNVGTFAVQAAGTLTNNNAAPTTNNIGALTTLANAAAPTWTEGDLVTASADLAGNMRVLLHAETTKVIGTVNVSAAQKIEVYDGTNTATVKAASTAAVAADTAVVVTEPGSTTAGACANTSVTSTSSDILAANTARREAVIVNTDVVVVFIGLGQTPTATAYHVALKPCTVAHDGTGGSFVTDTWKGQINAITASTSGHVAVTELT